MTEFGDGTRCVHGGHGEPSAGRPLAPGPVFAAPYHLGESADFYGRAGNPSWRALEEAIGDLDGGSCVLLPSGMAAISTLLRSVLRAGDRLHLTGQHAAIVSFCRKLNILKERVHSVTIIGGSRICYYLARQLLEMGISVKIFEQKESRCVELSELLPKALVIHGDGTQHELLLEERVEQSDALVALTGMDEENIILSLFAINQGVGKVVTKVSRLSYSNLMGTLGMDSVIYPARVTANSILRYVRAMQNAPGSEIQTLHSIVDNRCEALEFHVTRHWRYAGVRLRDLQLRKNLLLACILRRGRLIIPDGSSTIEVDDNVIVITAGSHLHSLADILKS